MSKKNKVEKEFDLDELDGMQTAQQNMLFNFLSKNKKVVAIVLVFVAIYILDLALTIYNFLNL
jgi:hypothetical protein